MTRPRLCPFHSQPVIAVGRVIYLTLVLLGAAGLLLAAGGVSGGVGIP